MQKLIRKRPNWYIKKLGNIYRLSFIIYFYIVSLVATEKSVDGIRDGATIRHIRAVGFGKTSFGRESGSCLQR